MMRKVMTLALLIGGSIAVVVFEQVAKRLHAWDEDDWQGLAEDARL